LAPDEVLTAIRFPVWAGRCGFAVEEIARRAGDFALVGVVCAIGLDGEGAIDRAGIGLFGVGATPVRARQAEQALLAGAGEAAVVAAVRAEINPTDDIHATAHYRRAVTGVLAGRAVARAKAEAQDG